MDFESSLRAPPAYHATVVTTVEAPTVAATARRRRQKEHLSAKAAALTKLPVITARTTTRTLERLPVLAGEAFLRDVTECIRSGQPIASTALGGGGHQQRPPAQPLATTRHGTKQPTTAQRYAPVPLPPIARTTRRADVRRQQLDRAVNDAATRESLFTSASKPPGGRGWAGDGEAGSPAPSSSRHHEGRAPPAGAIVRGVSPSLIRASSSRAAARIVGAQRKQATSKRRGPEWMEFAANDIMHSECVENARLLIARAEHLQRTSMLQFASNQMHAGNRRKSQAGGDGNRYTRQAELLRQHKPAADADDHQAGGGSPVSPLVPSPPSR